MIASGALLTAALRPKSSRQVFDSSNEAPLASVPRNGVDGREQALALWNNIKVALLGVAATRITAYISELVPGFDEHFQHAAQKHAAPRTR